MTNIIHHCNHYIDSPAEVVVLETGTQLRTWSNKVNGTVKVLYPGWYTEGKKYLSNLKQGSVLVLRPDPPGGIPGRSGKKFAVAGVCVYSAGATGFARPKDNLIAMERLFEWFWWQTKYTSIGMTLLGSRMRGATNLNSIIQDHEKFWNQARVKNGGRDNDRTFYLHSGESSYIAPIEAQEWLGDWKKEITWNPLFPQLESVVGPDLTEGSSLANHAYLPGA